MSMKQAKHIYSAICIAIAIVIGMNGCVVRKPNLSGVSEKDYNGRRKVTGAHYTKRPSVPGIILTAAAPVAGAIAGYHIPIVTMQKGTEMQPVKPANAAIGAVAGYSLANFINYCVGLNKNTPAYDPVKWTRSISSQYAYVPNSKDQNGNFYVIDKSFEKNYKVRDINDAKQFYALFPNSQYRNTVFQQAVNACNRSQMLDLLALDKNNSYANDAKKKYINQSSTYEELEMATNKFPEIQMEYEDRFAGLVRNPQQAMDFHRRYPNSAKTKNVIWSAFNSSDAKSSDISSMKRAFGGAFDMTKADLKYNPNDVQKKNYARALFEASNIKNETDLELFYRKYEWLAYNGKPDDIVSNVYKIAYKTFNNGNYLLYYLRQLPKDDLYKKWGVTSSIVNNCITQFMKEEEGKVKIASNNVISSDRSDWESWLNNMTYTAGIVAETGEVKYLVYGVIENNSKFDLPVTVTATADLMMQPNLKGHGVISGILGMFGISISPGEKTKQKVATRTKEFKIPSLPAKSKSSYAVMLNFGNKGNEGVNVADWFKIIKEVYLDHLQVKYTVGDVNVSNKVLEEQETWLAMAKNGMPTVPLTDLKRNERVDQSVWAERWEEERVRRAEAWAQVEADRAKQKSAEEAEKAVQKELENRKYDKKYKTDYDVSVPSGHVTEYYIKFGDGRTGLIAYMDWNRKWYCIAKTDPWTNPNSALSGWTECGTESEAINRLYEQLHQ